MICAGIDAGSRAIKIVLLETDGLEVRGSGKTDQGTDQDDRAQRLLDRLLAENGLARSDLARTVATGYGRNIIGSADTTVTEITCHARGVRHVLPDTATIVDIGGQDSKIIKLHESGAVRDFAMNDRCAAGTGCFLEMVARKLDVPLDELGRLASRSRERVAISNVCVVFAETEIIGLLADGAAAEDIVAGVQAAVAGRIATMAGRKVSSPTALTGGVALVSGMDQALSRVLGQPVRIAPEPQMTGALGAALLAADGAGRDRR
ncbi:MAG: 2-hydroxyglutaryl-CoA dehydratase [Candidatus Brocadiaceae bacterium]|mgnify:CR=1 FL=1|nr:2-hydroxyglutaryl-CoA dehydratase [Candidatus Brocadiaceae bacterium]